MIVTKNLLFATDGATTYAVDLDALYDVSRDGRRFVGRVGK